MPAITVKHNPFRRALRIIRVRPRLLLSALVGIAVAVLWPASFQAPPGCCSAGISASASISFSASGSWRRRISTGCGATPHARTRDGSSFFSLIVIAALASLGAIIAELAGADEAPLHLALAAITILLSWIFTHTIFALHYAYEYYDQNSHRGGGLNFPGDEPPDYWDFLYFSLVIGMTSQVSDVAVTSNKIRRMVAGHGVVSFVFNAMLLALTVNIAASLL